MEEQEKTAPKKMYICDPSANKSCSRSGCVLMGGTCFTTLNREFAESGPDGLPEEATMRKVLEMKTMIQATRKPTLDLRSKFGATSGCFNRLPASIKIIDPETTKIRKHTHDTLWAIMLGFAACAGLMIVIGLIIIAVLSYARG